MSIVTTALYERAEAKAAAAQDGTHDHLGTLYTLAFNRNEWVYVVTDPEGYTVVRLNCKSLSVAKRELVKWLEG